MAKTVTTKGRKEENARCLFMGRKIIDRKPKLVVKESNLSKNNLFFVVTEKDHFRFAESYSLDDAWEIVDALNVARGYAKN